MCDTTGVEVLEGGRGLLDFCDIRGNAQAGVVVHPAVGSRGLLGGAPELLNVPRDWADGRLSPLCCSVLFVIMPSRGLMQEEAAR